MSLRDKGQSLWDKIRSFTRGGRQNPDASTAAAQPRLSWRDWFNRQAEGLVARGTHLLERTPPPTHLLPHITRARLPALFLLGLLSGDLLMQGLGTYLSSGKNPPPRKNVRYKVAPPYVRSKASYEQIVAINPFCPGCTVPDLQLRLVQRPKDCNKAKPVEGGNLKVLGTIVLSNPEHSVVTLADGSNDSVALQRGDSFRQYGTIFEIRRGRVCFEGGDGKLTYASAQLDEGIQLGQPLPGAFKPSAMEGISRSSETDVEIKRDFLNEKLNDPNLLFQAHAVPYKEDPNAPQIMGFKILSMVPGSVYESLGMQVGDVLTGVNGEPLNSLAKAQELYANLRNTDEVKMDVLRGGRTVTITFRVK